MQGEPGTHREVKSKQGVQIYRMEKLAPQEQSSKIHWLLEVAEEQGYLTADQILEALPEAE